MTAGANPMAIKRGIDKAVAAIIEELKKISVPTSGKKEIAQVGTISANNDSEIGNLISEAMEKVGKDGVITVEEARGVETTLETVEGMTRELRSITPTSTAIPLLIAAKKPAMSFGCAARCGAISGVIAAISSRKSPARQTKMPEFQR